MQRIVQFKAFDVPPIKPTASTSPVEKGNTYKRKYYLHRRVKAAGFVLKLEKCHKTIEIKGNETSEVLNNKYVAELQVKHGYGVQLENPMMQ